MTLRIMLIILAFIFWPIALVLNSHSFPWVYLIPGLLVFLSLDLTSPWPLLFIPFIAPKLALLPFLVSIFKKSPISILISLIILIILFPLGQTIFHPDYERQQEIVRNIHLYPNAILARIYQNKGYIYLNKFTDNLTQILDPNNYFFANHPRELRDNPNLPKFPYAVIIFFFIGLFSLHTAKPRRSGALLLTIAALINLSILSVPFGHDFILWPIIFYLIFQGLKVFHSSSFRFKTPVYVTISFLSLYEFMQLLINR